MAEREGFEPPIPFQVCRFSRPVPSTTRPSLRLLQFYYSARWDGAEDHNTSWFHQVANAVPWCKWFSRSFPQSEHRSLAVLEQTTRRSKASHFNHLVTGHFNQNSCIKIGVKRNDTDLFREQYRVIAVEPERLTIRGIITGTVLTIMNGYPGIPLTSEEYPPGKLVALSDPSASAAN